MALILKILSWTFEGLKFLRWLKFWDWKKAGEPIQTKVETAQTTEDQDNALDELDTHMRNRPPK